MSIKSEKSLSHITIPNNNKHKYASVQHANSMTVCWNIQTAVSRTDLLSHTMESTNNQLHCFDKCQIQHLPNTATTGTTSKRENEKPFSTSYVYLFFIYMAGKN